jgi:hypothetical protein
MREEEVNREALICSDVCTVSTKRLLKHLLGPSSIVLPPLVRCENKLLSKPLIIINMRFDKSKTLRYLGIWGFKNAF